MRFAWYGRLSTKDKQDPTLSFRSQREACERKAPELGGRIVYEFTDQESGRRDDRAAWSELIREAKERDARRFDAVVIYATSRLSRDLFRALAYEREFAKAASRSSTQSRPATRHKAGDRLRETTEWPGSACSDQPPG
jgi:site-specific DNA recombinase